MDRYNLYKTQLRNYTYNYLVLFINALILFNSALFAQNGKIIFEHLNTSNGLSDNTALNIIQDRKGFLWIGTYDGLSKYDGYKFINYRNDPRDTTSLSSNYIRSIYEDKNGELWVGTKDGLNLYDNDTESFIKFRYSNKSDEWANTVLTIHEDGNDILWLGTVLNGLSKFDKKTKVFKHFLMDSTRGFGNSSNAVRKIISEVGNQEKKLWIGSYLYGLYSFDIENEIFKSYQHDPKNPRSLSDNNIKSLLQDSQEVVWIGTQTGGLNKFNTKSEKFTHYKHNSQNSTSLSHNNVLSIHRDPNDTDILWIGTEDGLNILNSKTNSISIYKSEPSDPTTLSDKTINDIYSDRTGIIWIGTNGGLNKYDPGRIDFHNYYSVSGEVQGLKNYRINSIASSGFDSDILWLGTNGGGLNRFDRSKKIFTYFNHNINDKSSISSDIVRAIYEDFDDGGKILWISTGRGLNRFDINNNIFKKYMFDPTDLTTISSNSIRYIYKTRDGMLWLTTPHGLNKFDRKNEIFTRYSHLDTTYISSLRNLVNEITKNRIPLASILVVKDNEELTNTFQLLKQTKILVISLGEGAENDEMWDYGWLSDSDGKEIWKMKQKESKHAGGAKKNRIQLWRSLLDKGTYKIHYMSDEGHSYGSWNDSAPINQNMWGIQIFEITDEENYLIAQDLNKYEVSNSIGGSNTFSIIEDSDGMLWIGTVDNGLSKFDRKTNKFINYNYDKDDHEGINDNFITALYEDSRGSLWIGTTRGLNKYDKESDSFFAFTTKDGLPNNWVYSILEDKNGNLWLATGNGISKFNPVSLPNADFINYNLEDGLQFNNYYFGSSNQTIDGEMYFGGSKGFVSFYPKESNQQPPDIVISDFRIFDELIKSGKDSPLEKNIDDTDIINLNYSQNTFSFEFVALHFSSPVKNKYKYKLEGFDKKWIDGARRYASYTNLDPGDYIFQVRASNSDVVWNKNYKSLVIKILPPWWRTIWAYICYGILLFSGIFSVDRFQRKRLLSRAKERMKIQEAEHRAKTAELQSKVIQAENDRKTKELEEARQLQLSMLPKELPIIENLEIAVYMKTATEVGGDYYDFSLKGDGSLNVCLGDATGHGMKAGTLVSMMKSLFTANSIDKSIKEFFTTSNNALKNSKLDKMMMAFAMVNILSRKIEIANAGIPPIYIYRKNSREVEEIQLNGLPLGAMKYTKYDIYKSEVFSGDTILILSDGFPELQNNKEELYGYERVINSFKIVADKSPDEIINHLKDEGSKWVNDNDPDDDVTFVVLKVK